MSKALLVIDMQEVTIGINHAKMFNYSEDLLTRVNEAIENTDAKVVVYISRILKRGRNNRNRSYRC